METSLWVVGIYLLITLIALPFQYRYMKVLEEMKRKNKRKSQGELYDSMPFEEQVLHANAQGNLFLMPANILAHFIYKIRHRNK